MGTGSLQHWGLVCITSSGLCSHIWDCGHVGDISPSTGLQVLTLAQAVGAAAPALKWQQRVLNPWGTLGRCY